MTARGLPSLRRIPQEYFLIGICLPHWRTLPRPRRPPSAPVSARCSIGGAAASDLCSLRPTITFSKRDPVPDCDEYRAIESYFQYQAAAPQAREACLEHQRRPPIESRQVCYGRNHLQCRHLTFERRQIRATSWTFGGQMPMACRPCLDLKPNPGRQVMLQFARYHDILE
jgi:hypothetical protein